MGARRADGAHAVALAIALAGFVLAPPSLARGATGSAAPPVATSPFAADPPGTFELPVIREAADFTVRDVATEELVHLSDLRGRVVVLSPFYTRCADGNACPLATATLAATERALAEHRLADRVVLLSVTFDEERDTPEELRAARRQVGASGGWIFATPETVARRSALLEGYDQRIARAPDGSITHPLRVYLIDGRGRMRQIYSQSFLRSDVLLSDIETLLGENPDRALAPRRR